jgi:hypothetical protein
MKTSSNILAEIKLAYQKQQLNGLELEIKVIEYAEMHRKEQLILSGVIGMFSADKLQEAYEDGEHYGKGGDALIFDIENYR